MPQPFCNFEQQDCYPPKMLKNNIVIDMNQRLKVIDLYQRFYSLVLEPILTNTPQDSEWTYFSLLMRHPHFDFGRIEQYLNIMEQDRKIKGRVQAPMAPSIPFREKRQNTMPNERPIPVKGKDITKRFQTCAAEEYREPIRPFHRRTESLEERKDIEKTIIPPPRNKENNIAVTESFVPKIKMTKSTETTAMLQRITEAASRLLTVFEQTHVLIR